MSYEITNLLLTCKNRDYEYLIKTIDSSEKHLDNCFEEYKKDPCLRTQRKLAIRIEDEIRYLGSSDIAYAFRQIFSDDHPGVKIKEIIDDVSDKLNIKKNKLYDAERSLSSLIKKVFAEELKNMSEKEKMELVAGYDFDEETKEIILGHLKKDSWAVLPFLIKVIGVEAVKKVVMKVTVGLLANVIGRHAADEIIKAMFGAVSKSWLGPVSMGISVVWTAIDLAGPAYRKTMPIVFYLGYLAIINDTKKLEIKKL